ncbi:MAG TPA: glycosyltransferase family 4 protein, partial [Candidatus Paceibacterota bacterium]|nr:glycosyltransferase family 4 protein [Candidatus Paceibacterota bacterium]
HLYDWKGAQTLADTRPLLPAGVELVFVGGTEADVASFKEKNSSDGIRILGQRPYVEIPSYLKAADVLVLPNSGKTALSRFYTSPMKLFEYMASGTPIVASDLPSMREVLSEDNSCLVESDNSLSFAQEILGLLRDEPRARDVGVRAASDVKRYTWQSRAAGIVDFITKKSR